MRRWWGWIALSFLLLAGLKSLAVEIRNCKAIFDYIELSPSYGIIEIVAPPQVIGKTLRESQIRSKYGLNLIAIKREVPIIDEGGKTVLNEEIIVSPSGDEKLIEGDVLVLIGKYDDLERFKKLRR